MFHSKIIILSLLATPFVGFLIAPRVDPRVGPPLRCHLNVQTSTIRTTLSTAKLAAFNPTTMSLLCTEYGTQFYPCNLLSPRDTSSVPKTGIPRRVANIAFRIFMSSNTAKMPLPP